MPFKYINEMRRNRGSRKTKPATDLTRWRLSNVEGRQTWQYFEKEEDISRPQTMIEKHALGLDTVCVNCFAYTAVNIILKISREEITLSLLPLLSFFFFCLNPVHADIILPLWPDADNIASVKVWSRWPETKINFTWKFSNWWRLPKEKTTLGLCLERNHIINVDI